MLGANHMSWLDDPDCGLSCSVCPAGTDDPAVTRQLSQGLAVAVFEHVLRGTPGAGDWSISMTEHVDAGRITLEARGGFGE